jgi:transcriptional regulator with XRE-family HTH domain
MSIIKQYREKQKMSQFEFAKGLDVNQTLVSQWERGMKVSIEMAAKIEKKYGLDAEKLCPRIRKIRTRLEKMKPANVDQL